MSMVIVAVGRRKTGKTTQTKEFLNTVLKTDPDRDLIIYDPNLEYREYYDEPFLSFDDFMKRIANVTNSCIHIEEATIFFESRSTNKVMKDKLVRARHQNNIIMLNFHSWGLIPREILSMTDYVRIFKTNDSLATVKAKTDIETIIKTFEEVDKHKDNFHFKLIDLYA